MSISIFHYCLLKSSQEMRFTTQGVTINQSNVTIEVLKGEELRS